MTTNLGRNHDHSDIILKGKYEKKESVSQMLKENVADYLHTYK